MKLVAIAGAFDPIHRGHLEHIIAAKALGDRLIAIVNPDKDLFIKKGFVFQPLEERLAIVSHIKEVDEVIEAIDGDGTVARTLWFIRPNIFAKGGDRSDPSKMPQNELDICKEIYCKIVYGVGGKKIISSSELVWSVLNKLKSPF